MNSPRFQPEQETLTLRIFWMLLFLLVWQVAQLGLGLVVLLQLLHRLTQGVPHAGLMALGASLSRYLAQIGEFGSFHSEHKPWPFADWPAGPAAKPGVPSPAAGDQEPRP